MGGGEDGLYKVPGQEEGKGWAYYAKNESSKKDLCFICRSSLDMSYKDGSCSTRGCSRNETLSKLFKYLNEAII